MIHEKLEIEKWIAMFPLEQERHKARELVEQRRLANPEFYPNQKAIDDHIAMMLPGGSIVCGARDIAINEQIRREALAGRNLEGLPTDIFLFARGEPTRREVTKLGGLPYWPASQEWPCGKDGKPLAFISQLCFADSRDLVGKLPGDVLLVFAPMESKYLDLDESVVKCFWGNSGMRDLIEPNAMPEMEFSIPPSYGIIYRTIDYPGAKQQFAQYKYPECLAVLEGTKIGGIPRAIQGGETMQGRFLCALGSLSFPDDLRYPFVNSSEPVSITDLVGPMWGDMGSLYVFLNDKGLLDVVAQCY
jgi:hypothetical protein